MQCSPHNLTWWLDCTDQHPPRCNFWVAKYQVLVASPCKSYCSPSWVPFPYWHWVGVKQSATHQMQKNNMMVTSESSITVIREWNTTVSTRNMSNLKTTFDDQLRKAKFVEILKQLNDLQLFTQFYDSQRLQEWRIKVWQKMNYEFGNSCKQESPRIQDSMMFLDNRMMTQRLQLQQLMNMQNPGEG